MLVRTLGLSPCVPERIEWGRLSGRTLVKVRFSYKHTRHVAIQSFLYVTAFFLGVSFTAVYHLIGSIGGYSAFWPLPIIRFNPQHAYSLETIAFLLQYVCASS